VSHDWRLQPSVCKLTQHWYCKHIPNQSINPIIINFNTHLQICFQSPLMSCDRRFQPCVYFSSNIAHRYLSQINQSILNPLKHFCIQSSAMSSERRFQPSCMYTHLPILLTYRYLKSINPIIITCTFNTQLLYTFASYRLSCHLTADCSHMYTFLPNIA
jgi:hypothetical protein